ncbi:hypothetical protein R70211_02220 [Paraburkholderia domus]|uniref:Glycosyltransferase family 2 protein n=1 Tax=Paraburkholderia domus TaxID=2793075 RepID=A0A9N8MNI8_9BURK|nr:hypothetical protein R70211_02220 [Paraburkholderia domus]
MLSNQSGRVFGGRPVSIQVQSILYNNDADAVERALASIARSAELALFERVCTEVIVLYGDCSPMPCLSDEMLAALREKYANAVTIRYEFFGANLGSARGHNRLGAQCGSDFLLIQNPDVVASPRLLETLLDPFSRPDVGMTEAKQLPIEHPKEYDPVTGETGWAATASAMIPLAVFEQLSGFDADSFFLYCDDVDFSWRVRLAGYKVIFQPAAVVFHDKRLSESGGWQPTSSERYYSAEAAMILSYKWSRPEIAETIRQEFEDVGDEHQKRAAAEFERRRDNSLLPPRVDGDHKIGYFKDYFYSKHRYAL